MSILRQPDRQVSPQLIPYYSRLWCRAGFLVAALLLALVPSTQAQVKSAQQALERLEGCDRNERDKGCINILRREPAGNGSAATTRSRQSSGSGSGKEAIKAQVRGGRIIWYEYDKRTGAVRRTN